MFKRIKFWLYADRLGPDMPITHFLLYFKKTMTALCKKKFKYFGTNAEFRPGAYAEACSKIILGDRVVIRPGSFLFADPTEGGGGIIIEEDVLIGACVHFYTNNHEFSNPNQPIINQGYPKPKLENSIIIRRGSWIGANVTILPGVEIGQNAVIGAGTIVTRSVPKCVVFAGNPGKVIRTIQQSKNTDSE